MNQVPRRIGCPSVDGVVRCIVRARFRWAAAVMALVAASSPRARALDMPSPFVAGSADQEHSGDAQRRGGIDNFTVFHAKISKPFRDQFPPEKLQAIFKDLVEKHAVFDAIVASPVIAEEDARIDEKGVLRLKGRFDTTPKKVKYQLGFVQWNSARPPERVPWKLIGYRACR